MAKNNKKKVFMSSALLVLAILIISGCGSFQPGSDEPPVSTAFLATGTEGLVLRFLPDQPPAKVYTQAPLTFLVEIWNRGTHRVDHADFYLTGYDMQMIPTMPNHKVLSEPLEGRSQYTDHQQGIPAGKGRHGPGAAHRCLPLSLRQEYWRCRRYPQPG